MCLVVDSRRSLASGIGPRAVKNLKRRPSRAALLSTNRPYLSTGSSHIRRSEDPSDGSAFGVFPTVWRRKSGY